MSQDIIKITLPSNPSITKVNVTNLTSTITGPIGATGASGLQGTTGPIGATGASGLTGTTGPIGATGASGLQGTTGPIGATGASGLQGTTGPIGATGASGLQGTTGPIGATGASGLQGTTGPIGATGASGLQGTTGPIGATGASGLTGTTGPIGATGASGLRGTTGFNGATGASGLTGTTGPIGATGLTGVSVVPVGGTGFLQYYSTPSTLGGNSNLYWDISNNRLGIGTGTPAYALQVVGQINIPDSNSYIWGAGTSWISGSSASNFITLNTAGTERMRITSTGNVGIGTTTPASTLDVSTTIRVTGDAVTRYGLITQYLDSTYIDAFGTGANTGEILFRTNDGSVSTLSLKANGNVGIGTTTPANLLDIAAPLGSGFGFDSPGQLPTLKFYRYAGGASTIGAYQLVVGETGASAGSDLSFKSGGYAARGSETLTTKVTFTNTGNVGIGTTSPTAKLQVAGDALINTLTVGLGAGSIATNTAVGNNALVANTTGANNTSVGYNALMRNSTGGSNTAIGYAAGYYYNGTTGNNLTPSNSVYIGNGTSPLADAQTNQIVIGDSAIGAGSNTVTLGNTSIVTTVLRGNVTATAGSLALKIPTTVATSTYTMTSTDSTLIFTGGACTVTLLAAATYPGRIINITNAAAGTIISATSNVVPGGSVTAGTALLSNAPGHFTWLQSDGTNWITIMTGSGN